MKFSQKVVAASSIFLLITVSLLSYQQLSTMQSEVQKTIYVSLNEILEGMKGAVLSEMEGKKELAKATTEIIGLQPLNRTYVKNIIERPALKSNFPEVGLSYDADGSMIENSDTWEVAADFDGRTRPWFIGAKNSGDLFLTDPYLNVSTKELIISIGVPVNYNDQFVAGMFYDFELSGLAELVNGVNFLDAGYLFIIMADGTTIAHHDKSKNGQNMADYLPSVAIEEGLQRVEVNGVESFAQLVKVPGESWYIGAIIDETIAFAALNSLRTQSVVYAFIGLGLSIVFLTLLIRMLMRPLGVLNTAIQDVASGQGDLTKRLDTNTDQEFAVLASGFNTFTESLQKQISQTKAISQKIKHGAQVTTQGAHETAQAINSQLEELEQLATAMNEMAMTAIEVAKNAQGAASAAIEADEATQAGSQIVNETTLSIDQLSARIDQAVIEVEGLETATADIETILKVINGIAEQTNLLALNAAIEAARAGETGRGFAVVADEVRTLAQRTQSSTTEIRSMIEQLQAGTHSVALAMQESKTTAAEAVDKAQAANGSLQRIHDAIQRISDMSTQIASAAEEQSLVAEEININTLKIKDLSMQVAESSQQVSSAMQEQTDNVHEQDSLLGKFIV